MRRPPCAGRHTGATFGAMSPHVPRVEAALALLRPRVAARRDGGRVRRTLWRGRYARLWTHHLARLQLVSTERLRTKCARFRIPRELLVGVTCHRQV